MKIVLPVTEAPRNDHTNFDFSTPSHFQDSTISLQKARHG